MHGPIDFIIVGFKKNNFKGEILSELQKAVDAGTISVLDMSMIVKDDKGEVSAFELSNIDDEAVKLFVQENKIGSGLIGSDDIAEVGELLDNDSSAGLLVVEQLWAKGLKKAIIDANGVLIAEGRIHPEAAEEIELKEGEK